MNEEEYQANYVRNLVSLRHLLVNEGASSILKIAYKFLDRNYVNDALQMGDLEEVMRQVADLQAMDFLMA